MAITRPCYCTREMVKAALDHRETARSNAQVDRAIESAATAVEGSLKRRFWPWTGTKVFDWPQSYGRSWRLWLGSNDLISVSALTAGGVTIAASDFLLRRGDDRDEPPYTRIETSLASAAAFASSGTHQRQIAVTGQWGYTSETAPAGRLAEALDTSETALDVSDSNAVGVGDLIAVDSERMLVTGKTMTSTGQTLQAPNLTANTANTAVVVTDATAYNVEETILLDSERMLIVDIAGNTLTVKRAWDGSVLAAHTAGATIYAPRTLTVTRAAAGTTAATHADTTPVYRHVVPGLIRDLAVAIAVNQVLQESAGYARVAGTGETAREFVGRGVAAIEADAMARYGRMARIGAV